MNVFLDCNACDQNFLRTEMTYINHVRNIQDADIYVMINRTWGSASQIFDLSFTGKNDWEGINNHFEYAISNTYTSDERRIMLKGVIEKGLTAYLLHTPISEEVNISVTHQITDSANVMEVVDPWNNWVFEIYGQFNFDYQQTRRKNDLRTGIRADYVTENWKFRGNSRLERSYLTIIQDSTSIKSSREKNEIYLSGVKSLGGHWSTGMFSGLNSNSYSNIKRRIYVGPALEFSLFPYSEVLKKEITLAYRLGVTRQNYYEESIFEKYNDNYINQSISLIVRYRQSWGTLSTNISGSHDIQRTERSRLEINNYANIRVFKGFSVRVNADIDLINDQIGLPKGEASLEDILLQQSALASNFDMSLGIGLNYTFGSIYNNVLNTRL
ncbi:MAG: hypothetical protein OCD76_14105 [Reichenbachiella sp.]